MFALLAAIFSGVGLVLSLTKSEIPAWLLWAVLLCFAVHFLVGIWPFNVIKLNTGRNQ